MSRDERSPDRPTRVLLWIGAAWSAALVVAALLVPAYTTGATSSPGPLGTGSPKGPPALSTTATLVQVNGIKVLALVGLPLVVVALVAWALGRRRARGQAGAGPVAWTLTVLVGLFALAGMLTIGIFVLPVAVLLVVACARQVALRPAPRA